MVRLADVTGMKTSYLSDFEKEKFARYTFPKRQREWLGGRYALKNAMALYKAVPADDHHLQDYVVSNQKNGRPYMVDFEGDISISHSKEYALAMVADASCGIDIQGVVPTLNKVEERYCSPTEKGRLYNALITKGIQGESESLAMLWACKEAVQKALARDETMPGFLELKLHAIRPEQDVYIFFLELERQARRRLFPVTVVTITGYAIALFLGEDQICQSSPK